MGAARDPVSVGFDQAAAKLLARAARSPGEWRGTYVPNPSPRWMAYGFRRHVNFLGRDQAPGGLARTNWCRSFVRAVYYVHRQSGDGRPVRYRVGTVAIAPGGRIRGRRVQIMILNEAAKPVSQLPPGRRAYEADGRPGPLFSDPSDRWWT